MSGPLLSSIDVLDARAPTWEMYAALAERVRPQRGEAHYAALSWALTELQEVLGEDWPGRAAEKKDPPRLLEFLALAIGHNDALATVLTCALQTSLFRRLDGFAKWRTDLTQDPRQARLVHTWFQGTLAAAALRLSWDVELEPPGREGKPPADIEFGTPTGELLVEVKSIQVSDAMQADQSAANRAFEAIRSASSTSDTWIAGKIGRLPTDAEITEFKAWVVAWEDGDRRPASWVRDVIQLEALPGPAVGATLTGPRFGGDAFTRLGAAIWDKVERMDDSGAGWLYVEARTGLWGTPWARQELADKLTSMRPHLYDVLGDYRPRGLILASPSIGSQGRDVRSERVENEHGIALRRVLPPFSARESLIFPLDPMAADEAEELARLVDAESDWLSWALDIKGLPSWDDIVESPDSG